MGLSNDLISQFVKATNTDEKPKNKTTTVYGTVVQVGSQIYVRFDGSDTMTPVHSAVKVKEGNRVVVTIKNHTAMITSNIVDPSASSDDVDNATSTANGAAFTAESTATKVDEKIAEFEVAIGKRVTVEQLNAEKVAISEEMVAKDAAIRNELTTSIANVETKLVAKDAEILEKLTASEAEIADLKVNKLSAEAAAATYATITNLTSTNTKVNNLEATHAEFKNATADNFKAVNASITELDTKKLDVESAKVIYANIDFSNIGKAAIEEFFSKSGMITDLVVGDGTITGELVGVTISGDLIKGNTVKADKLVVKGSDGLYYKLNIEAGATTSTEVSDTDLQNGLHGTAIIAKTITAEKISVNDLVAFGADIAGFHITEQNTFYSGAKSSVNNTTQGIYLDATGQMNIGDASNFIKYYKDSSGNYRLEISANSIIFSSGKNIETTLSDMATSEEVNKAQTTANEAETKASDAQTLIAQLTDSISMLVTDGNGTSLMTQTEDGWTFSTATIQDLVNKVSDNLNALTEDVGGVSGTVDVLKRAIEDLETTAEYVKVTTYEDEPCVEFGEADSDFKLRITNTRMIFTEGSTVLGCFTNQAFNSKKVVIEEELQQGGFVWKVRSNGNLGLTWKGGNS